MAILLLGSTADKCIQALQTKLNEYDAKYCFIDIYQDLSAMMYLFNGQEDNIFLSGIPLANYITIYWRYPIQENLPDQEYSVKELFEKQEIWNFLLPIDSISNVKCINPIFSNLKMENKIFQLDLAVKLNLKIPKTIISCNREEILQFCKKENGCIEKTLGMHWDENNVPAHTRKVQVDNFIINGHFPCIYQQYVKRTTELRIYIVGDSIIPIEISIPSELADIPDWRHIARKIALEYRLYEIPQKMKNDLLNYHKQANLIYAAYDFIVDENGEVVFLECNPNGNWQFLPFKYANLITEGLIKESLSK